MSDAELRSEPSPAARRVSPRGRPRLVLIVAALTSLISMATCAAAILAPAPAAAVPLVVACCVGAPIFAGWEAPGALASVRADRTQLARLRRALDQLPEVEHPLGL